jgi:ubiquinone/menaquinone biosynthesis C-methylase UbiE
MDRSITFDHIADRYDETRGGEQRGRGFAGDVLARLPKGRVLEVGIGTGSIAMPMREAGRTVVGVDLARPMLLHAIERLGPVVAEADAQHLPIASGSAPAVVAIWVLHLVADPAAVLAEAARVLTPGGRFVVITSEPQHEDGDEIDATLTAVAPHPPRQDAPGTVIPMARALGLRLVERTMTTPRRYLDSPAHTAEQFEQRVFSQLWAMDDATFAREVQPKIDALRALPGADRERERAVRHNLMVFARPS